MKHKDRNHLELILRLTNELSKLEKGYKRNKTIVHKIHDCYTPLIKLCEEIRRIPSETE